jgi:hypothetical protein
MAANIKPIRPSIGEGIWQEIVHHAPEGATQSFLSGAPLVNLGGALIQATSTESAAYAGLIGIAYGNASGVSGTDVPYCPLNPDTISFEITVDGAPSGGNAPGTGSLAANGLFGQYGIVQDAASKNWYMDYTNTTYKAVTVVDFIDPPGTVNGRVRVRFLHSVTLIN